MCGIVIAIGNSVHIPSNLLSSNQKRGPNSHDSISINAHSLNCVMHGFVLNLRGVQSQPIQDLHGNVLLFNGELYDGIDVSFGESDTLKLSEFLNECKNESEVMEKLSMIRGEWAIAFYLKESGCLYFGRDFLGKRSLVYHLAKESLVLASVSGGQPLDCDDASLSIGGTVDDLEGNNITGYWRELPARGIFKIDLNNPNLSIELLEWNTPAGPNCLDLTLNSELPTELPMVDEALLFDQLSVEQSAALDQLLTVLDDAVRKRVSSIPPNQTKSEETGARLGILFSGGLDCMVLAAISNIYVPSEEPIDLLNVSFENPRTMKHSNSTKYDVPDRKTGLQGYQELQSLCPNRKWRLVQVNVEYEETLQTRDHVKELMYPLDTVMDLSIAIAFWFASRGKGVICEDGTEIPYQSTAKVLLSGLGADEQVGGYSRHRKAFESTSWHGLKTELEYDVKRISTRNLGRDDRIISDHGKEVRFPYLDENVLSYLCSLPVQLKCDPRYSRNVGDKLLLRAVADRLGMKRAAREAKRAVQFGARTAKMELSKEKGHFKLGGE